MKKSLLLFLLLTIILGMINVFMYFIMPENNQLNLVTSAIVGLFALILLFPLRPTLVNLISPYQIKYYFNESVGLVIIFFIFMFVNFIAHKNDQYWDLTTNKINTLSSETKALLKKIDQEVEILVFANKDDKKRYLDLLNIYSIENKKIKVMWRDPNLYQTMVNQYLLRSSGDILLRSGAQEYLKGSARSESSITLALKKLILNPVPLYYLNDHGTPQMSKDGKQSRYSFLYRLLENEGFNLIQVSLPQLVSLESDQALNVMILNPTIDFDQKESRLFRSWYAKASQKINLILFLGSAVDQIKLPNFQAWLKNNFGITFESNLLIDQLAKLNNLDSAIIQAKNTEKFPKILGDKNFYPLSLGVNFVATEKEEFKSIDILQQSDSFPAVWGETDFQSVLNGQVQYDTGEDLKGPFPLLFRMSNQLQSKSLLFFASSQFISNAYKSLSANFHMTLNLFNGYFNQKAPILQKRLDIKENKIVINQVHLNIMIYFSIVFLPLLCLIWALANYLRRVRYQ